MWTHDNNGWRVVNNLRNEAILAMLSWSGVTDYMRGGDEVKCQYNKYFELIF